MTREVEGRDEAGGGGAAVERDLLPAGLAGDLKKRLARLYLVEGPERLIRTQVLGAIEAAVLGDKPGGRAFGRDMFAAPEARAAAVLAAASGLPMLGARRLVVVEGVERFRKAETEVLVAGLDRIPDTTVVVLVADQLDGRLGTTKKLRQRAVRVDAKQLAEDRLRAWIGERFKRRGEELAGAPLSADSEAIEELLLLGGTETSALASEIEKVALDVAIAKRRRRVSRADVDQVVAGGAGATLGSLTDAVGNRDLAGALGALAGALEAGEEPLRTLGYLNYRVLDLWRVALGVPGRAWPAVRRQAANYTPSELARARASLYVADRELKGGGLGPAVAAKRRGDQLVLERLLVGLMAEGRRGGS